MVAEPRQQAAPQAWHAILERTLKANAVKLVAYVPDRALTPLIAAVHGDPYFTAFATAREDVLQALAQPQRRVIALEGDGSLLMQLGCLSTIASFPSNLTLIVMDNGIYQITGGRPTPAAARSDVVAIAQGCGLAASAWAEDEEDFVRRSAAALAADKPTPIAVRIDDCPGVGKPVRDPAQIRERFKRGIGVRA